MWTPQMSLVRRISARLLRAHRSDVVDLGIGGPERCVDGITRGFVPTHLRRELGKLWETHGATIIENGESAPRKPIDDVLDARVTEVESLSEGAPENG